MFQNLAIIWGAFWVDEAKKVYSIADPRMPEWRELPVFYIWPKSRSMLAQISVICLVHEIRGLFHIWTKILHSKRTWVIPIKRCTPRFTDSSNLRLLQKSLTGKSIHASFNDWGYLYLAMAGYLIPNLAAVAKPK